MVTTIVEESEQGTLQMFTAGTGDLLPEYCSEIWTGSAVLPISDRQRRHIVDFYNKTSSSMTCYAFAYRPMYSATVTGTRQCHIDVQIGSTMHWTCQYQT